MLSKKTILNNWHESHPRTERPSKLNRLTKEETMVLWTPASGPMPLGPPNPASTVCKPIPVTVWSTRGTLGPVKHWAPYSINILLFPGLGVQRFMALDKYMGGLVDLKVPWWTFLNFKTTSLRKKRLPLQFHSIKEISHHWVREPCLGDFKRTLEWDGELRKTPCCQEHTSLVDNQSLEGHVLWRQNDRVSCSSVSNSASSPLFTSTSKCKFLLTSTFQLCKIPRLLPHSQNSLKQFTVDFCHLGMGSLQ